MTGRDERAARRVREQPPPLEHGPLVVEADQLVAVAADVRVVGDRRDPHPATGRVLASLGGDQPLACACHACILTAPSPRSASVSAAPSRLPSMSRAPKILAVASAVDLDFRYGCTPAWWQLRKG